jgi:hypothetical protein
MAKFLLLVVISLFPYLAYAQLDCEAPAPANSSDRGSNEWIAYVYQISPDYFPDADWSRTFVRGNADRVFKGYLQKDNGNFLPTNSINFDTRFGDWDGYDNDSLFFETTYCDVQLQNFGIIFRSRIRVPEGEPGVYRFTVGGDDGTRINVNGSNLHDNWNTGKTYEYNENIINYYEPYNGGELLYLDLFYYEKTGFNRLSFNFERYLGPGEIEGSQDLCGIAPDPVQFGSRGPAAFLEGTIAYQWQFSLVNDPDAIHWTDIPGADGLTYDIPAFQPNDQENSQYDPTNEESWSGIRYYRRLATNATPDGEETKFASNILTVSRSIIQDVDQQESGQNEWIGHIYRTKGNFSNGTYLGRMKESDIFKQQFGFNGSVANPNPFTPDYGCTFVTEDFSIRYKMNLDVSPGTYTFMVRGDDGYRLSLDGGNTWIISNWANGSAQPYESVEMEIDTEGKLDMVLEYYESTGNNLIDFRYEFSPLILPLEWGEVTARACGQSNCLSWETIQEKNTSHFELERSYDGFSWEIFDHSIQAQGYSTEKTFYQFSDNSFTKEKVYYRIRQVDMDSTFAYSDVMRVKNYSVQQEFLPFPNPTLEKIRFFSKQEVTKLTLTNHDYSVHRELEAVKVKEKLYEADLTTAKGGYYILSVFKKNGEKEMFKVIKK